MKYSKQRELVLKIVQENVVHPTADYIYALLKKELPNISLATVYRNLNLLADSGMIKKIDGLDGVARFDCDTHNHYHFICSKCNKVYDVPYEIVPETAEQILTATGLLVESYDISFKGICQDCRKVN